MPYTKPNRTTSLFLIPLLGVCISISNFYYINHTQITSNKKCIEQAITETQKKLDQELGKITLAISSLQVLFETADTINREIFDNFTMPFIKNLPGVRALEWAPKVSDEFREVYNHSLQAEGFHEHTITEADSQTKKLVPAKQKAAYFPIQFIAPIRLSSFAVGYDLSSNPDRLACIKSSQEKQTIIVSPPLQLLQNASNSRSFLVLKSVQQAEETKGVILGVYNMASFINTALKSELKLLDLLIYDKTADYKTLYTNMDVDWSTISFDKKKWSHHFEITISNRVWSVYYMPKAALTDYPHLPLSYTFLISGVFITFLLTLMVYMNFNSQLSLEQKVKDRTQELDQSNQEQAVLLKEIHHRVKNNLQVITSLLSLQSSNIDDAKIKEIFSVSQYRINTMAILHEELYQADNLSKIGYSQYLKKLVDYLIISIKGNNHNITLDIKAPKDLKLNLDTAIPLGLLINEILTNALKYGIPKQTKGTIHIQIIPLTAPNFQLLIGDNGLGFSDEINHRTTKSLGLKLIHQLARQLNGSIKKVPQKEGTSYTILFQEIG
ncbi:histidine kinase dimerization/phosphoacceptor domain -containing protein [Aureispira anguillae]|uniref:histidine kinase n=1 Tax=Aureispira anguillae TaxID=2864201 RepID=A0A915YBH6_9BACT|nr:histidine kinase dimerization/phosphoacceptor domain -containing protein [Aureispira anguillae]BDS09973.1 CHASE domain-containing protein [Aureispira anguillae]